MLKAALFDMDGLMFDTERLYDKAWYENASKYNIVVTEQFLMRGRGTNDVQLRVLCSEEFGEEFDYDCYLADIAVSLNKTLSLNVPHRPYLTDILEYLKKRGIKMAVASSTKTQVILKYLEKAGVKEYFSAIIGGDMVKNSKPLPDIYIEAAKALGEKPEECAAFEDSFNGVRSASSAGCITIMVPDMNAPTPEIASLCSNVSQSLKQAIDFLKSIE